MAIVGSSVKFCVMVCKSSLLWYLGVPLVKVGLVCQVWCNGIQGISALVLGEGGPLVKVGSSAKFCVVVFKSFLLRYLGSPLAKLGSSANFSVLVFKASLLWYWGGRSIGHIRVCLPTLVYCYARSSLLWYLGRWPLAKVGSSAKFCVVVFKSPLLCYMGDPLTKAGSSAKFCVVLCKSSLLWYWGSIGQIRFVCQVWCTGI